MSTTSMVDQTDIRSALRQFLGTLEGSWASEDSASRLADALTPREAAAFDREAASADMADLSQQLLEAGLRDPGGRAAELAFALAPASRDARRVLLECSRHYGFEPTVPGAADVLEHAAADPASGQEPDRLRHLIDEIEFSFRDDIDAFAIGTFRVWPLIRQALRLQAAERTGPARPDRPTAAAQMSGQLTFFAPRRDAPPAHPGILRVLDDSARDRNLDEAHATPAGVDVLSLAEFDTRENLSGLDTDEIQFYRTPWLGDPSAALTGHADAFKAASGWDDALPFLEALFDYPDIAERFRDPDGLSAYLVMTWAYAAYFDDLLHRARPRAVMLADRPSPKLLGLSLAARHQGVTSIALQAAPPPASPLPAAWPEEALLDPDHLLSPDARESLAGVLAAAPAEQHDTASPEAGARGRLEAFFEHSGLPGSPKQAPAAEETEPAAKPPAADTPAKAPAKSRPPRTLVLELDLRQDLSFAELYRQVLKIELVRKTLRFQRIYLTVLADPDASYGSWHFHNNMTMALLRLNGHVKGLNMVFSKAELKQYRRWWKRYWCVPYWIMARLPVCEPGYRKPPKNLKIGVKPARETQSLVKDWIKHRAKNKPFVTWSGAGHDNGQAQAIFERLDRELAGNYAILYLPPSVEQIEPSILENPRFLFAEEALYNLDLRAAFHFAAFANLTDGTEAALTPAVISDTYTVSLDGDTARVHRRGVMTRYASVSSGDSSGICGLMLENYFERA